MFANLTLSNRYPTLYYSVLFPTLGKALIGIQHCQYILAFRVHPWESPLWWKPTSAQTKLADFGPIIWSLAQAPTAGHLQKYCKYVYIYIYICIFLFIWFICIYIYIMDTYISIENQHHFSMMVKHGFGSGLQSFGGLSVQSSGPRNDRGSRTICWGQWVFLYKHWFIELAHSWRFTSYFTQ